MSARTPLIHALPCVACVMQNCIQPNRSEEHHLNLDGHAGQKRRGDEYSIPLCGWHHRGEAPIHVTKSGAGLIYGPSLALTSRLFRQRYGSDDALLARTNAQIYSAACA